MGMGRQLPERSRRLSLSEALVAETQGYRYFALQYEDDRGLSSCVHPGDEIEEWVAPIAYPITAQEFVKLGTMYGAVPHYLTDDRACWGLMRAERIIVKPAWTDQWVAGEIPTAVESPNEALLRAVLAKHNIPYPEEDS